eukprot:3167898-Amphidinium_carterae.1
MSGSTKWHLPLTQVTESSDISVEGCAMAICPAVQSDGSYYLVSDADPVPLAAFVSMLEGQDILRRSACIVHAGSQHH